MTPFPQPLTSIAAPLLLDNVDTDTIIPSREMKTTGRAGLADGLFAPWRYLDADSRTEDPDFVLNQGAYRDANILLGGANFGCGSSREHAVWALAEWGINCIAAVSFAPIFQGNCVRNRILPITLERAVLETLANNEVSVDLAAQTLHCEGTAYSFSIEPEAKQMLLDGLDAVDLTLTQEREICVWLQSDQEQRPWVYLS